MAIKSRDKVAQFASRDNIARACVTACRATFFGAVAVATLSRDTHDTPATCHILRPRSTCGLHVMDLFVSVE